MPLNTTSFLVSQGWEGVGVPLDGKAGKGLKKPLAITQKKTLSGIGKDRDRADDWWNSIFTASAKSFSIGPSPSSSGASTPTLDKSKVGSSTAWNMSERSAGTATMSLSSLAKREHARKTLMSNFVRGKPIVPAVEPNSTVDSPKPSTSSTATTKAGQVVAASDAEVDAALDVASSSSLLSSSTVSSESGLSKSKSKPKESDDERLARKLAKKALRKQLSEASEAPASDSTTIDTKSKKVKGDKKKKEKKKQKRKSDIEDTPPSSKKRKRDPDSEKTKVKKDKKDKKQKKDKKEKKLKEKKD